MNVVEAWEESKEETEMNNPIEEGESLMLERVLVKTKKKVHEPSQRKSMFNTKCKLQGKCCKEVIDSGSTNNLISIEMVENLGWRGSNIQLLIKCPGCKKDTSSW